ncbi:MULTISPECIES: SRPBCC domain-containing protein [unclassified Streptomyces]|uniref:SRPBCC family protein n=1 Tax=unclassified Streptomyces TaxID=2593676 RepID=UPI002DDC8F99|nr:SRPBCC domain-containing protein [Streptomyces sp. NBC_01750]WSA98749.1 SRPBCC domain-containing protein [Streptomyces sp. NBC_01794]WSD36681.1 SRPBCC domain-containing protein [Streptomyces sp. NBC_01750]
MADIAMQLHIEADADTVYTAISTTEGIRSWFTTTATADKEVDGLHELRFPGVPEAWRLRITEAEPGKRLVLAAENGPWTGTLQTYEVLARPEGGVTLRFTHSGFPAADDAYRDFTYGWATKFAQLKAYAETGKPAPFFTG